MSDVCPTCGAEMVPMILSSFCPRDCDRPAPVGHPAQSPGGILLDLSEDIVGVDGREWRAWMVLAAHRPIRMADLPPSVDSTYYGRYIVPDGDAGERDLVGTLGFSRGKVQLPGRNPGWVVGPGALGAGSYDLVIYVRTR